MRVLFLSNNDNTKKLYKWLSEKCEVHFWNQKLNIDFLRTIIPDLIISFNYKFIIENEVIEWMNGNIINLHISLLPWNRGANPNYWSFVDNTPKGVTIHRISSKLDAGLIICQKELEFDIETETFKSSYEKLNEEIINLFIDNWEKIQDENYEPKEQKGIGSYHSIRDFETMMMRYPVCWEDNIGEYLKKILRDM